MESIPGFLSVPRPIGPGRPAGAFFLASVVAQTGPGRWTIRLEGRDVVVQTSLDLTAGQTLRLKLVQQTKQRWEFQIVSLPAGAGPLVQTQGSALMAAFVAQGLPLATERLAAWSRWIKDLGPHDKATWAASLEARGQGPHSALSQSLEPWMLWMQALEQGRSEPAPNEDVWDEWNLRSPPKGSPWLVVPLHWEFAGHKDSGLLQARWNPQRQAIDRWTVTAAPAGTPFRVEADVFPQRLDLTWRFFRIEDLRRCSRWVNQLGDSGLSRPDLTVHLRIAGVEPDQPDIVVRGIDVNA